MKRKRHSPEEIIRKLRKADADLAAGQPIAAIVRTRQITWVTQRGKRSTVPLPRLRTVEECLRDPMPDQSWMDHPIPQERFTRWLRP